MPEITSLQIADVFLHKFLRARQANTKNSLYSIKVL